MRRSSSTRPHLLRSKVSRAARAQGLVVPEVGAVLHQRQRAWIPLHAAADLGSQRSGTSEVRRTRVAAGTEAGRVRVPGSVTRTIRSSTKPTIACTQVPRRQRTGDGWLRRTMRIIFIDIERSFANFCSGSHARPTNFGCHGWLRSRSAAAWSGIQARWRWCRTAPTSGTTSPCARAARDALRPHEVWARR